MKNSLALLAGFILFASAPIAWAQESTAPKTEEKKEEKKEEPKRDPKSLDYEKAIKDLPKFEGGFTLYVRRNREILLELPEDKLGQLWYLQAAFHTGLSTMTQFGFPIQKSWDGFGVDAFRFQRFGDDRLHMIRPNLRMRWDKDSPYAEASRMAFPEAILGDYRIEQTDPEKKRLLVNVSNLFRGELYDLPQMLQMALGRSYSLDGEKVLAEKVTGHADGATVRMSLHYQGSRNAGGNPLAALLALLGGGSNQLEDPLSAPVKLTYNMYWQPKTDYRPRPADPRIGYFTQDFFNIDRILERDRTSRLILRWNLQKKNPDAPVSDPVKPIVWVLDKSIPKEWRQAVRMGVLAWNPAFEKIGFSNALQVKDAEELGPDYDHADGRHNVIRFTITNGFDGAIALFRTDPFTGEVLNASVNSDMTWLFVGKMEHEGLWYANADRQRFAKSLLTRRSEDPHGAKRFNYLWKKADPVQDHLAAACGQHGLKGHKCNYGAKLGQQALMAMRNIEASGIEIDRKRFTEEVVATTISHEIGHCLGLRHNFVASTNLDSTQLANTDLLSRVGTSASVMDYVPTNFVAISRGRGVFSTWMPGPYDELAIAYGYSPARNPDVERRMLAQIASRTSERGLEYMTDENADGFDPFVQRFDLGRDPIPMAKIQVDLAQRTRKHAIARMPLAGQSFAERNQVILSSVGQQFGALATVARYVGGVQGSRAFRGDSGARPTLQPVDPALQAAAAKLVIEQGLSIRSLDIPESVLQSMSVDYDSERAASWTAPIRAAISGEQTSLLASLMSADVADRMIENEFKSSRMGSFTLATHYADLMEAVFSEVGEAESIVPLRRDLQRFAVSALIEQAGAPDGAIHPETRAVASLELEKIAALVEEALDKKADGMTKAHLKAMADAIERFDEREILEGDFGGGDGGGLPFPFGDFGLLPR